MLDLLLVSSTYRYFRLWRHVWPAAKKAIRKASGVEPTLFLVPKMIDWKHLKLDQERVDDFLNTIFLGDVPLSNGRHGVRVHGFTDFGRKGTAIFYAKDVKTSVALLTEQIHLVKTMAQRAEINDSRFPSLVTIHMGRCRGHRQAELKNIITILREIAPIAAQHRVIISAENLWDASGGYALGADLSDLHEVFSAVDSPFIGMTFDFAHAAIHYQGDYAKISNQLERFGLLSKIYHLHLTAPSAHYHNKSRPTLGEMKVPSLKMFFYLAWRNPDNQGGVGPYLAAHPAEKELFSQLVRLIGQHSAAATNERLHCGTVELNINVPGTHIGATAQETLDSVKFFEHLL